MKISQPRKSDAPPRLEIWLRVGETTRPVAMDEEKRFYEALQRNPKAPASPRWPYEIRVRGDGRPTRASVEDEAAFYERAAEGTQTSPANGAPPAPKRKRGAESLLLSKRAAAARLGIDRGKALDALIESGQLRAVKRNGSTAIPRAEVEKLASEGFDTAAPTRRRKDPRRQPAKPPPKRAKDWALKTR